jgi:hypothetical protein
MEIMQTALFIGASVSAVIGIIHACYVYRHEVKDSSNSPEKRPVAARLGGVYYGLWTFLLWFLLGTYVFFLWIVSCVIYVTVHVYKNFRRRLAAPPRSSGRLDLS